MKPRAVSSAGVGRRVKRKPVLVSYNDLDAALTGHIIYTLTPTPSFEYDNPGSNVYGSRLRISRSRARVVLRFSFRFSLRIFEQKRDSSHSNVEIDRPADKTK